MYGKSTADVGTFPCKCPFPRLHCINENKHTSRQKKDTPSWVRLLVERKLFCYSRNK